MFGTDIPLNEAITRHAKAGFKFLDFNFLDWQEEASSPFLSDAWEEWILSAGETAEELGVCFNQAHAPVPCLRFGKELEELLSNCSARQLRIILDIIKASKIAMEKYL